MVLDIYYHIGSQPGRSVVMFLKLNNIEFNGIVMHLDKGDSKTPEYKAMNPNQTIPTMKDDDFVITESVSMVKYLAAKHQTPDHWYPSDLKKRAKVDELLDWYHTNIRKHGVGVFYNIFVGPILGKPALTPEQQEEKYQELDGSMAMIETFLKDHQFLCGDEITIADIFVANEVFNPSLCERDIYENRPKVKAWMDRVRERVNPVWDHCVNAFKQMVSAAKDGGER